MSDGSQDKDPPADESKEPKAEDGEMTIWEHLGELRSRMVKMILAFLVGGGVAWYYREKLLIIMATPYIRAWTEGGHADPAKLHFSSPAAAFIAYIKVAAMGGVVLALPLILYQFWAFIAPGLYSREKKFAIPFVVSSYSLFGLGSWFGWRFAFPVAFKYLLSYAGNIGPMEVDPTLMVDQYLEFVTHMLLAFGFAGELPILIFFLSVSGIVTFGQLWRFFRYFVVLSFVISAILTPPDPLSQLLLAVPLCTLYLASLGIAYVFGRGKDKDEDKAKADS